MSQSNILLESGTNELEIIEFIIEEQDAEGTLYKGHYAMNVAKVLEIIRRPDVVGLPGTHHPAALGTFSLRGRVLPLIDLARWLEKGSLDSPGAKVIVSEFSGTITAFLVSSVTSIHRLSWSQIEAPDAYLHRFSNESITGVVRFEDRIVFLLDMERIVASMNPHLDLKAHAERIEESVSGDNLKTLIADDSSSIRNMIGATLKKAGFDVTATSSGLEAWKQLEAWKKESQEQGRPLSDFVVLVVSDIEMPEMDGHNLTRRIKDDPVLKQLPVMLFSSLITEALRHKGEAVGADDQVSKPDLPSLTSRARALITSYFGI
ncbi:chemotaxis protein [Oleidesulfovibrio alaskensis]|jgi:two-component system chemotaxis response regulator CheV|uniref:chemotaxis protein n=1 Tax=Oleidesulfovibrio alaskensis TaxID=58180 RepID=UPI0003FE070D|nr:chemotaxis protein [Oleidesulfovibrio alaskensis]MBL3581230.1 chemotaxis protein CheV [Oleidesulfovibrio alaskensis]